MRFFFPLVVRPEFVKIKLLQPLRSIWTAAICRTNVSCKTTRWWGEQATVFGIDAIRAAGGDGSPGP